MRNSSILANCLQKVVKWAALALLMPVPTLGGVGPPPVITVQPQSQNAPLLGIVTFSVTASSGTTMSYQWYKNGVAIAGATSSSYTILTVLGTDAGNYCVKVSNAGGWVMSNNATLNVQAPPGVITQPQSQTVVQGQNVSFSVVASGTGPLSYQWYARQQAVPSGTNATLTLYSVGTNDAGGYRVVMANSLGSATSAVATLTVQVPAGIATQPQNQSIFQGQAASFSVVASGTSPFSYQWSFNGSALAGATNSTLSLTNVQQGQAGNYTVSVSNVLNSVTSSPASLAVAMPTLDVAPAPPPGMSASGFGFQVSVPVGLKYVVLASSDLHNWTALATNISSSATSVFTDTTASNYSCRFYRAMLPQ